MFDEGAVLCADVGYALCLSLRASEGMALYSYTRDAFLEIGAPFYREKLEKYNVCESFAMKVYALQPDEKFKIVRVFELGPYTLA